MSKLDKHNHLDPASWDVILGIDSGKQNASVQSTRGVTHFRSLFTKKKLYSFKRSTNKCFYE